LQLSYLHGAAASQSAPMSQLCANLDALHEETLAVIAVAMGVIACGGLALMVYRAAAQHRD
jgi:hypothetical protein